MATCPKCSDEYLPLRLDSNRIQCDGKSRIPKSSRPGRVSSPSITTRVRFGGGRDSEYNRNFERAADADLDIAHKNHLAGKKQAEANVKKVRRKAGQS
jgi:hypothetical protein